MKKPPRYDWNKGFRNLRLFAAVVRSPASVRHAFDENRILALWWTCILSLHGRPSPKPLTQSDRCEAIAEGFKFYGLIYRFLAAMFFVSGLVVWICEAGALFWRLSLLLVGVYLWIVAGLAFSGALQFRSSGGDRIWSLVAFLFFVTLFLTAVTTVIGLKARMDGWLPDAVIFALGFGMVAFGIGSYLVELAALVADKRPEEARVK